MPNKAKGKTPEYVYEGETPKKETSEHKGNPPAEMMDEKSAKVKKFAENLKNKKTPNRRR